MEGALIVIALLACPIGMGLMMWFMGRGMKREERAGEPAREPTVEELRSEQARLDARIERAERDQRASNGEPVPR
jgi:hypothetical protein